MLGTTIVAVLLLLQQQMMTLCLLVPSTAYAVNAVGTETQPQIASVEGHHENLGTNRLHADEALPLGNNRLIPSLSEYHNEDQWQQDGTDENLPSDSRGSHHSRLRQILLNSLLNDGQQRQSAVDPTWFDSFAKRRAHIFVGKKSDIEDSSMHHHGLGFRQETDEIPASERFPNDGLDDLTANKRSRMFVGKRPTSFTSDNLAAVDSWMPLLLGDQYSEDLPTANKRSRMFVGKKHAPVFVGKR